MILRFILNRLFILAIFFLVIDKPSSFAQSTNPLYDKALADSLGADEYGMKMYMLVILKTGTNTTADKAVTDSVLKGHIKNINRLAKEGKVIVAGPLQKNDQQYRGIFILDVTAKEAAHASMYTDPAISQRF